MEGDLDKLQREKHKLEDEMVGRMAIRVWKYAISSVMVHYFLFTIIW